MIDMNNIIAQNIFTILREQGKRKEELAQALNVETQTVSKMLHGGCVINAIELNRISDFLGVSMEKLTRIPNSMDTINIVPVLMGKVQSQNSKDAIKIADKLSDMALFHDRVRKNGMAMLTAWEDS